MKKCPNCQQIFSDDNQFCLNDGTVLYVSEAGQSPVFQTPDSAPTQFFSPPLPASAAKAPADSSKWLFLIIGVMATALLALGITFFMSRTPNEKETVKTVLAIESNLTKANSSEKPNQIADDKSVVAPTLENKTPNSQGENSNIIESEISTRQIETPPLTAEAVRGLLIRWEKAQDAQNYQAYQTCYGQPFRGVKRADSETKVYNYATWLNDRRKILGNAVGLDLEIKNLQIFVKGDTATAEFDQYYRSVKFSDWGPKVIKIKMFPDGAKIVYEELKASYPLN